MTPDELILAVLEAGAIEVDLHRGYVFTRRWIRNGQPRRIGLCLSAKGYHVCTLHWQGQRRQVKVHRIIWLAAHGVPPLGYVPDHENRIKTDNRSCNLRLVTAQGNAHNRRTYLGEANPACRISGAAATAIRRGHMEGASYGRLAREHGVSKSLVAGICRREVWAEGVRA